MYRIQTQPVSPGPSEIEKEIRLYMRLYLTQRVWFISQAVVELIDALIGHPDFDGTPEQRCGFIRLAGVWRCIAWIDRCTQTQAAGYENSQEE
ncbi:MAG: hypothetical protein KJ725_14500 [Gammaproteobacteria bacterium]|uniref:hypothetical protein n=1 Tax=Methylotuvimicrobium sp. TaxID=2822413 RepID=UPI001DEBA17C|nr:hypothetical protein [Gammaproteobacteria bacterium]